MRGPIHDTVIHCHNVTMSSGLRAAAVGSENGFPIPLLSRSGSLRGMLSKTTTEARGKPTPLIHARLRSQTEGNAPGTRANMAVVTSKRMPSMMKTAPGVVLGRSTASTMADMICTTRISTAPPGGRVALGRVNTHARDDRDQG